ncbi:MAG TPA: hypothetical protein VK510_03155 [Solirubrobacteraceae bacterium]|nr:hypothetical protein [Solirubrobacteraceae bacterium]
MSRDLKFAALAGGVAVALWFVTRRAKSTATATATSLVAGTFAPAQRGARPRPGEDTYAGPDEFTGGATMYGSKAYGGESLAAKDLVAGYYARYESPPIIVRGPSEVAFA